MTADECRKAAQACNRLTKEGVAEGAVATAVWEVAAQLAELNATLMDVTGKVGGCEQLAIAVTTRTGDAVGIIR